MSTPTTHAAPRGAVEVVHDDDRTRGPVGMEAGALARLETARERRWCTVGFVLLHPLLAWVSVVGTPVAPGPGLLLTTGLSLALLLSVGPRAAVAVLAMEVVSALAVLGEDDVGLVVGRALLTAVVLVLVTVLLEERFAALGRLRRPRVVLEFLLIAAVAGAVVLALGDTAIGQVLTGATPDVADGARLAVAHAFGVLTITPGVRMLLRRDPLVDQEGDLQTVVLGLVATFGLLAVAGVVGGTHGVADAQVAAVPLLLVGFLVGTTAYGVTMLVATLVTTGAMAVLVTEPVPLDLSHRLSWLAVAAGGLLLAAEGDRRRRLTVKLSALFGHAAAPSAEVAPNGRVIQVNRAFATLLGWRTEELVDSDVLMLFAGEGEGVGIEALVAGDRDEVSGHAKVATRDGVPRSVRYVGRRLDEFGPGDGVLLVQLLDTTEDERRAAALERSNDALEQLGQRISHDLKQPLAAIAGYASTLRVHRDRLDDQTVDDMLDRLDHAARRVVDQLDSMVISARVGGDVAQSASLGEVLETVTGLVEIELEETDGVVETRIDVDDVQIDARALQQVLLNLVMNALKYHDATLPPRVVIRARARGTGVEVTVADNGPGIGWDDLERVFEPGRRLDPSAAAGRGMGLADSRRIVEDLGGWLHAEPSATGARFVLWIPDATVDAAGPVRTVVVDAGEIGTSGFRLGDGGPVDPVHVDVEGLVVVGRARSMSEAVALSTALEPDVTFVDRWVADGDGITALAAVATANPTGRIVVRTRERSREAVRAAELGGATRVVDSGADAAAVAELVVDLAG